MDHTRATWYFKGAQAELAAGGAQGRQRPAAEPSSTTQA